MIKKIFSHSLIYAIGPQIPKVIGLFLLPLLTPNLTRNDFGIWGTIMAYTMFFTSARDLGLTVPLLNSFYKSKQRWVWVWRQIIAYLLSFGVFIAVAQGLLLFFVFPESASKDKVLIISFLTIQCLLFDVPILIGTRYFQILEKPVGISIISIFSGLLSIGIQYYCIVNLKMGYLGWFYANFISIGAMALCYLLVLLKLKFYPIFSFKYLKPRLRVALPMIPHNYSSYLLNSSDRVILDFYKIPISQIGLYNLSYMWGNYMEVLGNAIGTAVGPMYFQLFNEEKNNKVLKSYYLTDFLQALFVVGSFLVAIWSKELFSLFIKNNNLIEAYSIAIVIVMSYSYRPLYWGIVNKMQFEENTRRLWKISFFSGMLNVVLNLILVPFFGFKVVAFTTFFALIYQGFIGYTFKENRNIIKRGKLLFWLALILFSTFLAFFYKDSSILFKTVISILSLSLCFVYIRKSIKILISK
ncbi:oligosaccharide flippase family protein [Sediminibacterium sp.]|uniref:lipopolysaccharide biosynthesis protein n=1 Tax=Sediminibacterium sp. TaxID=1917865 RepID=UPI0025FAA551|nr:oligosaccharide flippase family protein [Sediminibacterium sp.]